MQPEGWPGHVWLEGRTLVHLKDHQTRPSHMPRGPAAKTGEGFLNPAMAPAKDPLSNAVSRCFGK